MFKYILSLFLICCSVSNASTYVRCFSEHPLYVQDRINNELKQLAKNHKPVNHIQIVALNEYTLQVLITFDILDF